MIYQGQVCGFYQNREQVGGGFVWTLETQGEIKPLHDQQVASVKDWRCNIDLHWFSIEHLHQFDVKLYGKVDDRIDMVEALATVLDSKTQNVKDTPQKLDELIPKQITLQLSDIKYTPDAVHDEITF